ncbi:uncharacterized protein B0P05DRAFT_546492 [Gilbertella persicaria]|uniref:uncharacterized protein n=1 Tax=Gilbertella persicaria TaxID=101096 RepID=UPI00221ED5B8|nr:uncharacterized protein B0P05DRAFT_546492 [Gilbertella persicaria]KAI8075809.1 hypothetical protein B0P05DRAFT_546492 [Gilbertella persicaria]
MSMTDLVQCIKEKAVSKETIVIHNNYQSDQPIQVLVKNEIYRPETLYIKSKLSLVAFILSTVILNTLLEWTK